MPETIFICVYQIAAGALEENLGLLLTESYDFISTQEEMYAGKEICRYMLRDVFHLCMNQVAAGALEENLGWPMVESYFLIIPGGNVCSEGNMPKHA
mmetsp:Transcript_4386/g.10590  ORF Transcript_4386/g.10590 Transcript_4386/m.10590 type:complete len:97 (+) Transcript_4386:3-293(+)